MIGLINFATSLTLMMENVKYRIVWSLLIISLVAFVGCTQSPDAKSDELVINGQLTNSNGRIIRLSEFEGNKVHLIDSVSIGKEETFSFRVKINSPGFYIVSLRSNDNALLIGKPGETIRLTGDAVHLSSTWNAKGSDETHLYLDYWSVSRKQLKRIDSLTYIFRNSHMSPEYMTTRIQLDSIFNAIMDSQRDAATKFINKYPGSLASLLVIDARFSRMPLFNEDVDFNYYKLLDSCLTKTYSECKPVIGFHNRVQQIIKRHKNHQEINRVLPPGELNPSYTPNH